MSMSEVVVFFFVIYFLSCPFFTAAVATSKGHSGIVWFLAGLFFGILALIASVGMADVRSQSR
jgi:hypothetical protein